MTTKTVARISQPLLLDSQIRDWVVLPLLVIMITAGLLRAQVGRLLRPPPKAVKQVDKRAKSSMLRSSRLRSGAGNFLSSSKWESRRLAWSAREVPPSVQGDTVGWLRQEATRVETEKKLQDAIKAQSGEEDPMATSTLVPGMDPSTMMDGMKGNMAAMVQVSSNYVCVWKDNFPFSRVSLFFAQNMVMMQGIGHFFRGFVLVRVPFPLTRGFKQMVSIYTPLQSYAEFLEFLKTFVILEVSTRFVRPDYIGH